MASPSDSTPSRPAPVVPLTHDKRFKQLIKVFFPEFLDLVLEPEWRQRIKAEEVSKRSRAGTRWPWRSSL